jgi:putative peptide zinc metalloprotease protein
MPAVLPAAASELERRKKIRLRLRRDLAITPQKYEGRTYYVVKDPVSLRYYRFKEQEHFLIQLMDGSYTLDDAQKEYEKRFRPERLTLEDLEGFAQQLLTAGLAQNESPQAGKQLFDRRRKRRRSEWMQTLTNILYIKIPVYDPDKLLNRMLPVSRWIFTSWFLALSVCWMLAAVLLVLLHFETFWERVPDYHAFFSFKNVVFMWAALGIVKVIHEFGHGLSCKAFGGEVHEMGALFLVFSPCLYCNVSDAWTLPNKWKRIIISFAGIYVELVIAATATFIWWNTGSGSFVNNLCLSLMIVCSVSTVVFNANPLMRYDGYYILADWLEIPNLRDRSNRYLQRLVMDYCLGIEVQPEQYMALWRRILFVTYAIVSYIYRWVVTFSILFFMYKFLEPHKLGTLGKMMAVGAALSMVGWPTYRMGKNLNKRGRLPDMKSGRVTLSAIGLAAILFLVFLVPLPVARVRQAALVQVQERHIEKAILQTSGVLEELLVRDGQEIKANDILAKFRSLDLENELAEYEAQGKISDNQYEEYTKQAAQLRTDPLYSDKELDNKIAQASGEKEKYKTLVANTKKKLASLTMRAPQDGIVMGPPRIEEVGKYYEKGTPICKVGDPHFLRVLIPLSPADYRLLLKDFRESTSRSEELAVDIRIQGRGERVWHGKLHQSQLPESQAQEVPVELTNKGGGSVAIKPNSKPGHYIPQTQQFLVSIDILDPDYAIAPGTMAQVKIHCKWHTAAWWAWRSFATAFDLGSDPVPDFMVPND